MIRFPPVHITASAFAAFAVAAVLAVAGAVGAQEVKPFTAENTGLSEAAAQGGYTVNQSCAQDPGGCIPQIIGQLVNALLGIFGALFLVLIMYGGVQYMLSQGDESKVKSAKQTIVNAVIGMIVVAVSYAIASYVVTAISGVTGGTTQQ